ncbi:hypothetical protein [Accumulibacter sp.]|uniref:hypothetical protein n=1 Tax=Accumulibacter sp. TaxID=2053492 RepID=UPI002637736B|nr:hypothetical protein [Accumulibacter sp.]
MALTYSDGRKREALFGLALLVASMTLLLARPACAAENKATIAAVEALLSLPQTQPPEGGWEHLAPPGFVVEDEEEDEVLVAWLEKQRKLGADMNAMRHGGTMLHHAIRAGMVNTASWLLANGADPLKEGEHDALELALIYRQETVFDLLVRKPGVRDAHRSGVYRAWKSVLANNSDEGLKKLITAHVPVPAGKNRELLLDGALAAGNARLIRALTAEDPDGVLRARVHSTDEDFEIADQRLPNPIFLSLIGQVVSVEEVDRLFQLQIRRPWNDAAFATGVVGNVLRQIPYSSANKSHTYTIFERIPAFAFQEAFKNKRVLSMYWRWLSHLPARERAVAMARWGDFPVREPEALLTAVLLEAYWFNQQENDPEVAAAWGELLALLRPPLPNGLQGRMWMFVPQIHRLTLLQLGYRPSSEELRWWIDKNSAELIDVFWPAMLSILPELGQRSHELLFRPVVDGSDYYCVDRWTIEKVLPLTAAATMPERPYAMEASCWFEIPDEIRQTLLSRHWVKPPLAVAAGRFVLEERQCAFLPTAAWRRKLAGLHSLTIKEGESVSIDGVMAVEIPGEQNCALLTWGGSAGGRLYIDDDSFEGTRRFTPCADGIYTTSIWLLSGEQINSVLQEGLPFLGGMTLIRDTNDGEHYWLGGNESLGSCGQTPPALFRFEADNGKAAALRALQQTHPAMEALLSQCKGKDPLACLGAPPPLEDSVNQRVYPEGGRAMGHFADMHWNVERKAFVNAFLDFKPEVLRAMKAEGVFPHWGTEALSALSASQLSLAEKRRRAAWLFRDRALLGTALESQMLDSLVDWLPREDWEPIIEVGPEYLSSLQYMAERKGKAVLACRFSTALKQVCGPMEE